MNYRHFTKETFMGLVMKWWPESKFVDRTRPKSYHFPRFEKMVLIFGRQQFALQDKLVFSTLNDMLHTYLKSIQALFWKICRNLLGLKWMKNLEIYFIAFHLVDLERKKIRHACSWSGLDSTKIKSLNSNRQSDSFCFRTARPSNIVLKNGALLHLWYIAGYLLIDLKSKKIVLRPSLRMVAKRVLIILKQTGVFSDVSNDF